ncbi:hypothetical protein [Chitinimonas sp.]|uniref:hypothetical protein n=1 Tax=Chitinimonas sp. TaxID=1934313 RepID=UPI0039C8A22B
MIMVHGHTSHCRCRGRFPRIAAVLNAAGYAAFAFDLAGCGESKGESLGADKLGYGSGCRCDVQVNRCRCCGMPSGSAAGPRPAWLAAVAGPNLAHQNACICRHRCQSSGLPPARAERRHPFEERICVLSGMACCWVHWRRRCWPRE